MILINTEFGKSPLKFFFKHFLWPLPQIEQIACDRKPYILGETGIFFKVFCQNMCNFQKKLDSKRIESVVGSVSDPDLGSIIRASSETSLSQQGSDFYDRLLLYSTLKRFDCARDWDSSHSDIVISLHPWLPHCRHVSIWVRTTANTMDKFSDETPFCLFYSLFISFFHFAVCFFFLFKVWQSDSIFMVIHNSCKPIILSHRKCSETLIKVYGSLTKVSICVGLNNQHCVQSALWGEAAGDGVSFQSMNNLVSLLLLLSLLCFGFWCTFHLELINHCRSKIVQKISTEHNWRNDVIVYSCGKKVLDILRHLLNHNYCH